MAKERIHFEQYIYLPALTHNSAIIAWGGFYFEVKNKSGKEKWKLLEDEDIPDRDPDRPGSIGLNSKLWGEQAEIEIIDTATDEKRTMHVGGANHAIVRDLKSDTEYRYSVKVRGKDGQEIEWARGPLNDWNPETGILQPTDRKYDNRFRTFPDPQEDVSQLNFAVIGDFGRGVRKATKQGDSRCQSEIAEALERAVDDNDVRFLLTTGDNIYAHRRLLIIISDSGDEDKDWFYTYYQPYRYILNRVPVFASFGNHDEGETEEMDDRDQLYDNLYIRPHFEQLRDEQEAVTGNGLCYRFRFGREIEFICLDTSKDNLFARRFFELPANRPFLDRVFSATERPAWRVVFTHHPVYCAGPNHGSRESLQKLMSERGHASGVRVFFSGHEHNFQHSRDDVTDYFITGGSGKFETTPPHLSRFAAAKTRSWGGNDEGHFLLVKIDGQRMEIQPLGKLIDGKLRSIRIQDTDGRDMESTFTVSVQS